MRIFKKINSYIAINFLLRFGQILLGFSLLIFFINFMDALEKVERSNVPFYTTFLMAFLQIPDFLNDVVPSLILMSAITAFFLLSSKSEITVIRSSGFSLWQVVKPMALCSFLIGIFWVTIFDEISIQMSRKFDDLERKYVRHEIRESVIPRSGIWIKQSNVEKAEEDLIIQAKKIYKNNIELNKVTIWFFDKDGKFYQKIDAEKMFLKENFWLLEDITFNDSNTLNKRIDNYSIKTDLKPDFVIQKIVNNFQNVKLFSIFELSPLIKDLESAGFSSTKFKVYLQSLLSKPLLFLSMVLIACFFGLNHARNQTAVLMIFLGVTTGLILYITSSIMNALGSSGIIPIFASTWVMAIICLSIGILLIYKKENI